MNVKNLFCAIFVISSFYTVISGYSFHKTFKSPKEKYDELVEEKDKLEILERSNFSIEEDENEEPKSKHNAAVDNCPKATAIAQVHVRFGKEHGEDEKNDVIHVPSHQHPVHEKRSFMFDPYLYQQFLYYMFLNGGQFGHPNCGTCCGYHYNPHTRNPACQNYFYCPHHSNFHPSQNYAVPYDPYNPNSHFFNSNSKRDGKNNRQIKNLDEIQNVPVKQLTKEELQLVLKYLDSESDENNNEKSSFPGSTATTHSIKKCQKRSVNQNCQLPSYYRNSGLKVTSNLELIAVNISEFW